MDKKSKVVLSGIFTSMDKLTQMITYLEEIGVSENDISILMSEDNQDSEFSINVSNKSSEDATKGFAAGSVVGAFLGSLTMAGAVVVPALGLIVAGPIVGILTGIAAGGIVGSLIGALVGMGIPEYQAKFYEKAIKEKGNILLVTHINKKLKSEVLTKLETIGATHISKQ